MRVEAVVLGNGGMNRRGCTRDDGRVGGLEEGKKRWKEEKRRGRGVIKSDERGNDESLGRY